jgi:hypothetical protein
MDESKIGATVRIVVGCESGNCVGRVEAIDEHGVDVKVTTHDDHSGQASSLLFRRFPASALVRVSGPPQ